MNHKLICLSLFLCCILTLYAVEISLNERLTSTRQCLVLYFPQCAEKKRRHMFVVAVAVCSVVGSIYRGCKKVRIFTVTQGPLSVVPPGRAPGTSTQVSAARGQLTMSGLEAGNLPSCHCCFVCICICQVLWE